MPSKRTIHLVSLGCPKNRVDSEVMLGIAFQHGYSATDDPSKAKVIVVNTCGFIDPAKRESIDVILQMAQYKTQGVCKRLIVTGCLSQRHPSELADGLPEVDALIGSGDVGRFANVLEGSGPRLSVGQQQGYLVRAADPRVVSTGTSSAYVKIAEGCDRSCAFCVIPALRGKHRSRPIADVVREAEALASQGVFELNLVSQDTSAYGRDLKTANSDLAHLVRRVADVKGIQWVRLLYLYPDALDDALIDLFANHPHVLPYVDMPMQHASDRILKRMRRGHQASRLRAIVERLRNKVPTLTLRTAFIVGFPGETDDDFRQLEQFVSWAQFDRLGVFRYSDEEETHAFGLDGKVPPGVSYNRARHIMALQKKISRKLNRKLVGSSIEAMVEGPSDDHPWVMVGRHSGQAPEIDGRVYWSESDVAPGQLRKARVLRATDYDLVVQAIDEHPIAQSAPTRHPKRSLPTLK